jgi:23S rRNA (adenine2503-C2)-methyltransferase
MIPLQAITPTTLTEAIPGVPLEEARRIVGSVHRHDHLPAIVRNVRRVTLDRVRAAGTLPTLAVHRVQCSRIDPFVKYSLETLGGEIIETVRIPLERHGRFTVCVSSQAGCGLGCAFCATSRLGFQRNLETWEIVEQVRVVRRGLNRAQGQRVHGIVFQGMGEPLANLDNVVESIRVACEPSGLAVDGRAITVCTAGLPAGIRRLAHDLPSVRLALSIASPIPETRRRLMPIDHAFPLEEVLDSAVEHSRLTGLAPMWSFTLLDGVNDSINDARELARLARDFTRKGGLRPRISIVPFNPIDPAGPQTFGRSSQAREEAFRQVLSEAGLPSHKRYSGGADILGACGQLVGSCARNEGQTPLTAATVRPPTAEGA